MGFPDLDRAWTEVYDFCEEYRRKDLAVIAPCEFATKNSEYNSIQVSYFLNFDEFGAVIFHKGKLDEYPAKLVEFALENGTYVFGNSVFVVVFFDNVHPELEKKKDMHFDAFAKMFGGLGRNKSFTHVLQNNEKLGYERIDFRKRSNKTKYLLVTANCMGNLGDDVLTAMSRKVILDADPEAEVLVSAPPPKKEAVDWADAVVIGGGGLLYDSVYDNVTNYMQFLLWAQEQNKPTACIGLGVQGIKSAAGREVYRRVLDECCLLTVRDKRDKQILVDDVGLAPEKIDQLQDLGFMFSGGSDLQLPKLSQKPRMLVALVDSTKLLAAARLKGYQDTVENWLPSLSERFEVNFITQSHDDIKMYERIVKGNPAIGILDPVGKPFCEVLSYYEQSDILISSRFHGVIFAALTGIPTIGVGTRNSKIHRLITNSLPSMEKNFIPITKFLPQPIERRLRAFELGRLQPADSEEVTSAIKLAHENVNLFRSRVVARLR